MTVSSLRHVVVLGAGVAGITTAYYLSREGFRVTVLEQSNGVATGESHANAGLISTYHAAAWASPQVPLMFLKGLFSKTSIFRLRWNSDPAFLLWAVSFLRNCLPGATREANILLSKLVFETQELLNTLIAETGINLPLNYGGMFLYTSESALRKAVANLPDFDGDGRPEVLDRTKMLKLEPTLAGSRINYVGGLHVARDFSGDCREYSVALAQYVKAECGVSLLLDHEVTEIRASDSGKQRIVVGDQTIEADDVVLCLGSSSGKFARKFGLKLNIYPVKGYSISVPIRDPELAPKHFGLDEEAFIAFTVLGDKFRVASFVELSGYDREIDPVAIEHMKKFADNLAPGAFDIEKTTSHVGLRPMRPDGTPFVGKVPGQKHMWVNSGHGHKGWAISCACSQRLARQMARK